MQYIEQPTHRDLRANPENRMHEAAQIKPVVIDESLVDLESLLLAREQGYSGVALKACKGHSEALLMGAAAQKYRLFLCVQDLTCVGAVVPAFRQPGRPRSHGRRDRGQRPPVLPGRQSRLGRALPDDVPASPTARSAPPHWTAPGWGSEADAHIRRAEMAGAHPCSTRYHSS